MNNTEHQFEQKSFSSPEEELQYLRAEVGRKEKDLADNGIESNKDTLISAEVEKYSVQKPELVLEKSYVLPKKHADAIVLDLAPEEHDKKMEELVLIMQTKGVYNALSVVSKMHDSHLYDDFHRFLVAYVKAGFDVERLKEKSPLWKALHMTLYEISLPEASKEEQEQDLKHLVSGMEQFYAGMCAASDRDGQHTAFTIEIAKAHKTDEFVFYVAVPNARQVLFEKQILSIFHNAKIRVKNDDYNIYNESGVSVGAVATVKGNAIFPLKSYEQFDIDPLNVLLNSFSKIDKDGEGAAVQFVINPSSDFYIKKYKHALKELQKGVKTKKAIDVPMTGGEEFMKSIRELFSSDTVKKDKDGVKEQPKIDETAIEEVKKKITSPIVGVTIRIVASSGNMEGAEEILSNIEAAFEQFENTVGNKLVFKQEKKSSLEQLLHDFSYRTGDSGHTIPINLHELTTVMHFPSTKLKSSNELMVARSVTAPAPANMPKEGTLIGVNRDRNTETKIFMLPEDRMRHFYSIGQTGVGKTTLLKNMIAQDILAGAGVCMIDPHGSDIQDILSIIPKERFEDVIYFDPSYMPRPMGLNMLEYDMRFPEQKTFVVNELLSIFNKLFDMKTAGGPMFELYFRNSVLLTMEDPDSGNTLLEIPRVLASKPFRDMKLSKCRNPMITQFWKEVAEKAGGEASLANIVPYISSKFDVFLSNDIMRPIVAQEKSTFNFRDIMDNKKILLCNLAKGRLGDINSHLIGLILVGKILMAALSRVDSFGKPMSDFYLYIDEFQNVTTDSIATILSEARKYRLSLYITHQYIAQLEDKIKDAVFGNVGSIASFRVGAEDAEYLEKQFSPVFTAKDLMNLDNRNAYVKMLVRESPVRPFNIATMPPPKGDMNKVEALKELSYLKYGRERSEVENEILAKYATQKPTPAPMKNPLE
jgi:hypothetical protein